MNEIISKDSENLLYGQIKEILSVARNKAYSAVNFAMVEAYWHIGKQIVDAQGNTKRAEYGDYLLKYLSKRLTADFGKGFTTTNLAYMRQFYLAFPIHHALRDELSWTHYRLIMRVLDEKARHFYIDECIKSNWSTRQLERQINTLFYQRLLSSQDKAGVSAKFTQTLPTPPHLHRHATNNIANINITKIFLYNMRNMRNMKKILFAVACLATSAAFAAPPSDSGEAKGASAASPSGQPVGAADWQASKSDTWRGFTRHHFTVGGRPCWVIVPKKPRADRAWIWGLEFPMSFETRTGVIPLVEDGFYFAHMSVGNTFGSPAAQAQFDMFYDHLLAKGLNRKAALIGISRGGLYAYRFAARHPERVTCIYGDAPVCDFKSWPGGKGKGKGGKNDWALLQKCYGFKSEAEALAFKENPVDILGPLAKAGVPLIHVVGDADDVVPADENTAVIEQRYKALGGTITVFHKPGVGHHPHGLDNPAPVVALIKAYAAPKEAAAAK